MGPARERRSARTGRRFLEDWAARWVYPGELSTLTTRAAAFAACGRAGAKAAAEPEPLVQGFALRPEHDVYAVGRGVGAAEESANTGYWALGIGLHEVAESLAAGGDEPEVAGQMAARAVAARMREAAQTDAIFESAGCAVTALSLGTGRPILLHAGDCVAVRLRGGAAQALTAEHTLERDSRDKGIPIASPYVRSVLLRVLGAFESPRGDPEVFVPDLAAEDRVLLLSTDAAARFATADYAAAFDGTPAEAGRRLLDLALSRKAPEAAVVVLDLA